MSSIPMVNGCLYSCKNEPELCSRLRTLEINPLNAKRRLLYLKTQFVPRSKHFSSRL